MESFAIEVTAHRIGGADALERAFQPRVEQVNPNGVHFITLDGRTRPAWSLELRLGPWRLVRSGLLSTDLQVLDVNRAPIGSPRPVLFNTLPCDVPLYSNHIAADADYGVISIGFRSPRYHWVPGDLETIAEVAV
jgi:hypothetical protein